VKEKNVMNHKKVSRSTFLSERLQQDVVVSLEEMEFVFFCATMRVGVLDSADSQKDACVRLRDRYLRFDTVSRMKSALRVHIRQFGRAMRCFRSSLGETGAIT
jgi:hypothetical protein